jgi:cation transport ATPase
LFFDPLFYISMGQMLGCPAAVVFPAAGAMVFALTQLLLTWSSSRSTPVISPRLRALLHGAPNMDTLVCIGSGAALVYGVACCTGWPGCWAQDRRRRLRI